MSDAQMKILNSYSELMHMNAGAHIFRTAVELGLFDVLAAGPKQVSEIVKDTGLDANAVELLLDSLCTIGAVERYGDDFALAQVLHVLPPEFRDLGDRYWRHLTDYVRTGKAIPDNQASDLDEVDFHIEADSSEWMQTPAAMDFVRVLDIGKSRTGLNVLDLRCGAAVWSLAIAHADAQATVTAVDQSTRLAGAQENAEAIGVTDRYTFVEGDYRSADLPSGPFDLVILANAAHLEREETLPGLFRRAASRLKVGGELAVVDVFSGQDKGDRHRRLYQLGLALRTSAGVIHGPAELQAALTTAGLDEPQFAHLPAPPYVLGLMLAARS